MDLYCLETEVRGNDLGPGVASEALQAKFAGLWASRSVSTASIAILEGPFALDFEIYHGHYHGHFTCSCSSGYSLAVSSEQGLGSSPFCTLHAASGSSRPSSTTSTRGPYPKPR